MSSSVEAERCNQRNEEVIASRDSISSLPNDLLIQILLLVPTKDAVATMVLSKRWRYIWTLVPKIEYTDTSDECESVWKFLDKLSELHKAPSLETLCIQLGRKRPSDVDVGKLVANAVDRFVRKVELELLWIAEPTSLPKSLYTCKTLVEMTLSDKILVDVPSSVCLPSLKILRLFFVIFKDEFSLERLVSSCLVLAGSRVYLAINDSLNRNPFPMANKLRFDVPHIFVLCKTDHNKFLRAISIVTSLYLSLKDPMSLQSTLKSSGITFSRLQRFKLHTFAHLWLDQLSIIINNSPQLRCLNILDKNGYQPGNLPLSWNQPSLAPRCLSSHLKEFAWEGYKASKEEKQLMRYILANSKCLKKVTVALVSTSNLEETKQDLKSMPRVSTSELLFG